MTANREAGPSPLGFSANWEAVTVRGTNLGYRPIEVRQAFLGLADGQRIFAAFEDGTDPLPAMLMDGETVTVAWSEAHLAQLRGQGLAPYATVVLMDAQQNVYEAPYPGVRVKRAWSRRWKRYVLPDGTKVKP